MKIAALAKRHKIEPSGAVDETGEQLWIEYDPFAVSWDEFYGSLPLPEFLAKLVTAWNVTYDDGSAVPITVEGIVRLPRPVVPMIAGWVLAEMGSPKG